MVRGGGMPITLAPLLAFSRPDGKASNRPAQSTARITSDALVPPKPKELDSATLISRLRG
jgi:hypothetical protein